MPHRRCRVVREQPCCLRQEQIRSGLARRAVPSIPRRFLEKNGRCARSTVDRESTHTRMAGLDLHTPASTISLNSGCEALVKETYVHDVDTTLDFVLLDQLVDLLLGTPQRTFYCQLLLLESLYRRWNS